MSEPLGDGFSLEEMMLGAYAVELFYERSPMISRDELLERLRQTCGKVEPLAKEDDSLLAFLFHDYSVRVNESEIPAQCALLQTQGAIDARQYEASIMQSRKWDNSRQAVLKANASLLATDLMAHHLSYSMRLELFQKFLTAALDSAPCLAIHWIPSQQFIKPEWYLESQREEHEHYDFLYGAVNARMFTVSGAENEIVMDTMGLAALDLPDLQIYFRDLNPARIAAMLYAYADYLYENGDLIEDGHTIQGVIEGHPWRCFRGTAMIAPERTVIDILPNPPFIPETD